MWGGYVWASVGLAILAMGAAMAYAVVRFARSHGRRPLLERRTSIAVLRDSHRRSVK